MIMLNVLGSQINFSFPLRAPVCGQKGMVSLLGLSCPGRFNPGDQRDMILAAKRALV